MVCTSQKIRLHYLRLTICSKIRFLYSEKLPLLARKSEKTVSTKRKCFAFKWVPSNFNNKLQQQKKSCELKYTVPKRQKVSTGQNEGFVEKYVFTRRKGYF